MAVVRIIVRAMPSEPVSLYSRKNPFPAPHKVNRLLSGLGSGKETRHHEICLAESGLAYEVGDSLGVFPSNNPALVDEILGTTGLSGAAEVTGADGQVKALRDVLIRDVVVTVPGKEFLAAVVAKAGASASGLAALTQDVSKKKELEGYLWGREVIDFLFEFKELRWEASEFVGALRKLQPRLYSIASSRKAVGEAVHLTIATVRYDSFGRRREGVASSYLADRSLGSSVPVFIHTAKHFRLPEDRATDVVMVGPGTGVAPFRAFLQERAATGGTGRNWLFFGEQRRASDFLYEEELMEWHRRRVLAELDVAFSRDQAEKIYVQHRMRDRSAELYAWLEGGAYFYVCGDAERMAKDVEAELVAVIRRESGRSEEAALEYVKALKDAKRYRKDVY